MISYILPQKSQALEKLELTCAFNYVPQTHSISRSMHVLPHHTAHWTVPTLMSYCNILPVTVPHIASWIRTLISHVSWSRLNLLLMSYAHSMQSQICKFHAPLKHKCSSSWLIHSWGSLPSIVVASSEAVKWPRWEKEAEGSSDATQPLYNVAGYLPNTLDDFLHPNSSLHPPSTFLLTSFLSILSLIALVNVKMASWTFWPDFALVSKNSAPYSAARIRPFCSVTTCDSSRSHLLPRIITSTSGRACWVVRGMSWGEQEDWRTTHLKLIVVNITCYNLLLWQPCGTMYYHIWYSTCISKVTSYMMMSTCHSHV